MQKAIIETLKGDDKNGEKYYVYPVTLESAVIDENGVSLEDKLKEISAEAYSPEEIDGIIDEVWKDQSIGDAGNNGSNIEAYSPEEIDGMIDSIWSSTTAKEAAT